jgi:hypothetical protein
MRRLRRVARPARFAHTFVTDIGTYIVSGVTCLLRKPPKVGGIVVGLQRRRKALLGQEPCFMGISKLLAAATCSPIERKMRAAYSQVRGVK